MASVSDFSNRGSSDFRRVVEGFLLRTGLPFADVLSAERVERIFKKHGNLFGVGQIYSTVVVLWSFLSQVFRDGKEASCQAAVARIVVYNQWTHLAVPTSDTGDYCRARAKLSEAALRDLTTEIGAELEERADSQWLWKGLHAKLVDGFTFTMPDTPASQAEYPSPKSQKAGVGLPIARAAVILSLATACVLDLAIGPYSGKETGETALLRQLLGVFDAGDVAVMDRYYCSFMMIALLLNQKVQVCARMHQIRHVDFRRGKRLGKHDHLLHWTRPQRPIWMDDETYQTIPETLELREIRLSVTTPGSRTTAITIATTLTDAKTYTKAEIAELYGFRWNSELDIRDIKQTLHLNHVRCQSPAMVRKELWTTLLGYNLIRTTTAAAALLHRLKPRQLSFTSACQYVLAAWTRWSGMASNDAYALAACRQLLEHLAHCEVANRPDRLEPRVIKRRRHHYPLMQEPRQILRDRLLSGNTKK
jgi:putative transposase